MTRKKTRENLYLMLFRVEFHSGSDVTEQAEMCLEEIEKASGKAKEELRTKFHAVIDHMDEINAKIEEKAKGWTVSRIAKADLAVLRLAIYEILFDEDVPNNVAINEAVELSKLYGTDKSSRFVNGILASIVRELPDEEGVSGSVE